MPWISEFDAFAHDIRHYLRQIVTQGQIALQHSEDSDAADSNACLERIVDAGHRCDELVRAMVSYMEAGASPDLYATLQRIVRALEFELEALLKREGCALSVDIADAAETPVPASMQPVLSELVRNAVKFGAQHVSLTARLSEQGLAIDVDDDGIGIDPNYSCRIFEPFTRLHNRDRYEGFGLGLAKAKRMLLPAGGDITLGRSSPGSGSTFAVRLPILPSGREAALD